MSSRLIEYEGYKAKMDFDREDLIYVGQVLDIDDYVGFHGKNEQELIEAFHNAIANYKERTK